MVDSERSQGAAVELRSHPLWDAGGDDAALSALPFQTNAALWQTRTAKAVVNSVDHRIRDQLNQLTVTGCAKDPSLLLERATARTVQQHQSHIIQQFISGLAAEVQHNGRLPDGTATLDVSENGRTWSLPESRTESEASFNKTDVMGKLEQVLAAPDPAPGLKQLNVTYDILDLVESDQDTFLRGFQLLVRVACTATPEAQPEFLRTFHLISSALSGRLQRSQVALQVLLHTGRPCTMDLSGVVLTLLQDIPGSYRTAHVEAVEQTAPVMAPLAVRALSLSLCELTALTTGSRAPFMQASGFSSTASKLLDRDPDLTWWCQLLTIPALVKPLMNSALGHNVFLVAMDVVMWHRQRLQGAVDGIGNHGHIDGHVARHHDLLRSSVALVLSIALTKSRADMWRSAIASSSEAHRLDLDHAVQEVIAAFIHLRDLSLPYDCLASMGRRLRVMAAHAPRLMHVLCSSLPAVFRLHLDVLTNRGGQVRASNGAALSHQPTARAPSDASTTTAQTNGVSQGNGDAGGSPEGAQAAEAHAIPAVRPQSSARTATAADARILAWRKGVQLRMVMLADVVTELSQTAVGREVLFIHTGEVSFGAGISSWLTHLPGTAAFGTPETTAPLKSWLSALWHLARQPNVYAWHLWPAFQSLPHLLDGCTRPVATNVDPRTQATSSHQDPRGRLLGDLADEVAAVAAVSPPAAAALLAAPPRVMAHLITALSQSFAVNLALTVAMDGSDAHVASKEQSERRRAAVKGANDTLRALGVLALLPSNHRAIMSTGVDAALARALVVAPLLKGPADDDMLVSRVTTEVVQMWQTRLRWPHAAAVISAASNVPNINEPNGALLGLLKDLHLGSRISVEPIASLEDSELVLSALLAPWLGNVTSEALLAALLPLQAHNFVACSCNRALGLPDDSSHDLGPPSMHDHTWIAFSTCGHGIDSSVSSGDYPMARDVSATDSTPEATARAHLPMGLAWAADSAAYVNACRFAGGDHAAAMHAMQHGKSGHKRGRSAHDSAMCSTQESPVAQLAAVATSKPGMHDKHEWWRSAASALATLYTSVPEDASDAAPSYELHISAPSSMGDSVASGQQSPKSATSGNSHDVCLLLQRILMVAMVQSNPNESPSKPQPSARSRSDSCDHHGFRSSRALPPILERHNMSSAMPLSDTHMRVLQTPSVQNQEGSRQDSTRALQLPQLLASDDPLLVRWASHAQRMCDCFGLSELLSHDVSDADSGMDTTPVDSGAPSMHARAPSPFEVSLAKLHHACSVACGSHRSASAVPEPDHFVLLMHVLAGDTPVASSKLPAMLQAASAAPVGRFVWPRFSLSMHGPAPLLMLCSAARIVVAQQYPTAFAVLERACVTNEVTQSWLLSLFLPVLTPWCASRVVALALAHGPVVLCATVAVIVGQLQDGILKAVVDEDDSARSMCDWLHKVHCYDSCEEEFLSLVMEIEGLYRDELLALLMCDLSAASVR